MTELLLSTDEKLNDEILNDTSSIKDSFDKKSTYDKDIMDKDSYLYQIPADESKAEKISKAFQIFKNFPNAYEELFKKRKKSSLFKYGIDISCLVMVCYDFLIMVLLVLISQVLSFIIYFSINGFHDIREKELINFDLYLGSKIPFIRSGISLIVIILCLINMTSKIKHLSKKYYNRVASQIYLDESIFSIFIKNLPYDTKNEELINYLKENFKISEIKQVLFLKDMDQIIQLHQNFINTIIERNTVLAKIKAKIVSDNYASQENEIMLSYKSKLEEIKEKIERKINMANNIDYYSLNKNLINMDKYNEETKELETETLKIKPENAEENIFYSTTKRINFSRTAIVTFKRNEDKNQFFRDFISFKQFFTCIIRKPFTFRGKRIYIENVPQIDLIDFRNVSKSPVKRFLRNPIRVIIVLILSIGFSSFVYWSKFRFLRDFLYDIPVLRSILFILFISIIGIIIRMTIRLLRLSDKYLEHCFINSIISVRNFNSTLYVIYIIFLFEESLFNYERLFEFIAFNSLRYFHHLRFNFDWLLRFCQYYINKALCVVMPQYKVNFFLAENQFDPINEYFQFRNNLISCVLLLIYCPLIGLGLCLSLLYSYKVLLWSLVHSEYNSYDPEGLKLKPDNRVLNQINYFGFFFKKYFEYEILHFFIIFASIYSYRLSPFIIYGFIALSEIIFLFQIQSFLKQNINISVNYDECKFKKEFKDSKWIDTNKIHKDIN